VSEPGAGIVALTAAWTAKLSAAVAIRQSEEEITRLREEDWQQARIAFVNAARADSSADKEPVTWEPGRPEALETNAGEELS
jgi:predicted secreted acid phosphatase